MGPYQAHKPDTDSYPAQGPDTFSYQPKKPDLNPNLAQGTDMGLISLNCRKRIPFQGKESDTDPFQAQEQERFHIKIKSRIWILIELKSRIR